VPPNDHQQFVANMLADQIIELVKAAMDGKQPLVRPRDTLANMIRPYLPKPEDKKDPYRELINAWSDRFIVLCDAFRDAKDNHEVAEATHRFIKAMDGSEADHVRQERERLRQQVVALEDLLHHAWIHTAYRDLGYDQMDQEQREMYDSLKDGWGRDDDEIVDLPDPPPQPAHENDQYVLEAALALFKLGLDDDANTMLDGHGIEEITECGRVLRYINLGDTYDTTVCHDLDTGEMWIGSWGDWVEQVERDHCEATNTIHCAYCGAFTPRGDEHEWREVVCESCGHHVDGAEVAKSRD